MAGRQPNPRATRKGNHRRRSRAVSAPITRVSAAASGAPSTVTRTCAPIAITIEAGTGGASGSQIGMLTGAASPASGVTRTRTNAGASVVFASCRRQRYSKLAPTPASRAISDATAPGSLIAATSRAFSAALQRRRRSTDVMTSIRFIGHVDNLRPSTRPNPKPAGHKAVPPGGVPLARSPPASLSRPSKPAKGSRVSLRRCED
jgi:hypothetical protein